MTDRPDPLQALNPLDGRYQAVTRELAPWFSEAALIRRRVFLEIEYLLALSNWDQVPDCARLGRRDQEHLRELAARFS
ncbi:MAG: adenylosuccinate lyase, partial [Candidatus Neomarinimicrobiota bacterium]